MQRMLPLGSARRFACSRQPFAVGRCCAMTWTASTTVLGGKADGRSPSPLPKSQTRWSPRSCFETRAPRSLRLQGRRQRSASTPRDLRASTRRERRSNQTTSSVVKEHHPLMVDFMIKNSDVMSIAVRAPPAKMMTCSAEILGQHTECAGLFAAEPAFHNSFLSMSLSSSWSWRS